MADPDPLPPGRARQAEVYLAGVRGRRPRVPVDPDRLERRARRAMSRRGFAYVAGGAGSERTIEANRAALDRLAIVPRVLRDVSRRDISVELLGRTLPAPLVLAPVGVLEMARRRGDLLAARAAAAEGIPFVFSTQASVPMEECARAMGDGPRWFQLYWSGSDELVASFLRRAEACGCEAIVVTLDTGLLGWRPRDLDLGFLPFLTGKGIAQYTSDEVFRRMVAQTPPAAPGGRASPSAIVSLARLARAYPGSFWSNLTSTRPRTAVRLFLELFSRPSLGWDDLGSLRELTRLPVVLKGVLHPADAAEAVERGAAAIVVSNHGGRQIDGAIAAVDALPAVVAAVGGRVPVLLDSGVRGGADVVRALALGARAVLVGRPYVYGLAIAGDPGVREVIRNIVADLDLTMGLAGCASLAAITPDLLAPASSG